MITTDQVQTLLSDDATVVGSDGKKIGDVSQVFLDDEHGNPEWVTVKTGLFGSGESFVPLAEASIQGTEIHVPYDKDRVKDAHRVDDENGHLSHDQEDELFRYYGVGSTGGTGTDTTTSNRGGDDRPFDQERTSDRPGTAGTTGTAGTAAAGDRRDTAGHDTSGPDTDSAMTRSEEQVHVGTQRRETGRARLRKFVVTENVTKTVPVTHEEVRVVHEPITEENCGAAQAGADISSEEHELTLHADEVVVDKETVPVERVGLEAETVTEQEQVTEEVRKEQIETDLPER